MMEASFFYVPSYSKVVLLQKWKYILFKNHNCCKYLHCQFMQMSKAIAVWIANVFVAFNN